MLFSILIIAFAAGLLLGGKVSNLLTLKIKYPILVFISVIIEYSLIVLMRKGLIDSQPLVFIIVLVQYLFLFTFLWFNRKTAYSWLIAAGSILNFIVIMANNGSMPLSRLAAETGKLSDAIQYLNEGRFLTYHILNENTRLWFLGDVIFLPKPFLTFYSVGDIVLLAGLFMIVFTAVRGKTVGKESAC